jgi:hypothetical protein
MDLDLAFLITSYLVLSGLFSMSIWGDWAEKLYERNKKSYWTWYWLRFFKIPITRDNCIRFTKNASAFSFIVLTLGAILALMFYN